MSHQERTNRKIYIYTLKSPTDDLVMYVGKSTNPELRLQQHIWEAKRYITQSPKRKWLRSLLDSGLLPQIEVIDECDDLTYRTVELYWLNYFKELNPQLVNMRFDPAPT